MKTCPICANEFEDTLGSCPRHDSAAKLVDESDPLVGVIIRDRYQLTEVIGRGAMGVVYKGTQTNDGKEVAIKVLQTHLAANPESLKRFQHEARAASSLMHPNIVRLYDVGVGPGGQPYIAMEYLDGVTLGDFMRSRKFLNTVEALPIIRQVCEALAEAHSHGVLHRDIKPANIMLMNRFGQENFVVVLDFSIAKVIQRASDVDTTTPGLIFGSPAYMSPERFMGRGGDFRSDIYSVGIIMFQMLAGRAPFKSSDLYTLMNEHIGTPAPLIKDVRPDCDIPDALQDTITRALAKKEKDRQENMKQLLAEINEVYRELAAAKQAHSNELPAYTMEQLKGTAFGGNGGGEDHAVATATKMTPDSGMPVAYGGKRESGPTNIFDIDPGLTPAIGLPIFQRDQDRKPLEDALASGAFPKAPAEAAVSGIWSKSLQNRTASQGQSTSQLATTMRKKQGRRINGKLIALSAVGLLGVASVAYTILQANEPQGSIEKRIAEGQLRDAGSLMESWHVSLKPTEEETYAGLSLNLGKAFLKRGELTESGRWLEQVPDTSKFSNESKRLLKGIRKN